MKSLSCITILLVISILGLFGYSQQSFSRVKIVATLESGSDTICAVTDSGIVCNKQGLAIPDFSSPVHEIDGGYTSFCAHSVSEVKCWNDTPGSPSQIEPPLINSDPFDHDFVREFAATARSLCLISDQGRLFCKGPDTVNAPTNQLKMRMLVAGGSHFCAVQDDINDGNTGSEVICWGSESWGGSALFRVPGEQNSPSELAIGVGFACGIFKDRVRCWGKRLRGLEGLFRGQTFDQPNHLHLGNTYACFREGTSNICSGRLPHGFESTQLDNFDHIEVATGRLGTVCGILEGRLVCKRGTSAFDDLDLWRFNEVAYDVFASDVRYGKTLSSSLYRLSRFTYREQSAFLDALSIRLDSVDSEVVKDFIFQAIAPLIQGATSDFFQGHVQDNYNRQFKGPEYDISAHELNELGDQVSDTWISVVLAASLQQLRFVLVEDNKKKALEVLIGRVGHLKASTGDHSAYTRFAQQSELVTPILTDLLDDYRSSGLAEIALKMIQLMLQTDR